MDPSTRLRRHSELYEAGTSNVQRIAIGGLIFAALILFNVIEPYYRADLPSLEEAVVKKQRELNAIDENLQEIANIEAKLNEIAGDIARPPWNDDVEELKRYFREDGSGDIQNVANTTINNIAAKINALVVEPLRAAIAKATMTGDVDLIAAEIENAVETWRLSKIDNSDWFQTTDAKDATADIISSSLQGSINRATVAIEKISSTQETRRSEEQRKKSEVDTEIDKLKEKFADAVDSALPAWAKGFVSVDTMIKLYPWILISIAAFLLFTALKASRHYHGMADADGWTMAERADPLLSSPWTLTDRGIRGSAITCVHYAAVFMLLGYFLYRSANPAIVVDITTIRVADNIERATGQLLPLIYGLLALGLLLVGFKVRPTRTK